MALKITSQGKVDKRTKEYQILCEAMKKARKARAAEKKKPTLKKSAKSSSTLRRNDGRLDQRTKEGKAAAERMAKARAARGKKSFWSKFF